MFSLVVEVEMRLIWGLSSMFVQLQNNACAICKLETFHCLDNFGICYHLMWLRVKILFISHEIPWVTVDYLFFTKNFETGRLHFYKYLHVFIILQVPWQKFVAGFNNIIFGYGIRWFWKGEFWLWKQFFYYCWSYIDYTRWTKKQFNRLWRAL